MNTPEVSILIVSFDTVALTDRCLDALAAAARETTSEVILVDNASADGSAHMVRADHPTVTLVANRTNVGFARAVNQAARIATAPLLLLLNPDTVPTPGSIDAIVAFARAHPGHGVYGGRTLREDGRLDPRSCWGAMSLWSLCCFATMLDVVGRRTRLFDPESLGAWPRDSIREVGMITGCFLLAEAGAWGRLGGLDERFFMYGEDADLSFRARRAGFRPIMTPDAEVLHVGAASPVGDVQKAIWKLQARATIVQNRWSPVRRYLGMALLEVGVAARAAVAGTMPVRSDRKCWKEAWRLRRSWMEGYPPWPTDTGTRPHSSGATSADRARPATVPPRPVPPRWS